MRTFLVFLIIYALSIYIASFFTMCTYWLVPDVEMMSPVFQQVVSTKGKNPSIFYTPNSLFKDWINDVTTEIMVVSQDSWVTSGAHCNM